MKQCFYTMIKQSLNQTLVLESVHGNIYYTPVKETIDTNSASETYFYFVKEQEKQTDYK